MKWKRGTVTPLYKNGDRHSPKNYRPVTLTSVLCRTLERIVKEQLMSHVTENNLLNNAQHGFLPGRSCLSNLLSTLEEITDMMDSGFPVDEIFLDLQKAFDSVPHQRLIYKLSKLGIEENILCWIESFLFRRKQRVSVNGSYSVWSDVYSGVPQGSVLGPLLFILYINDMSSNVKCPIKIFADDTKLYNKVTDNVLDAEHLQEDLNSLSIWCDTWKLKFNPAKCHVLHIGKQNMQYLYHINGHLITPVMTEKDLGVIMSRDMKQSANVERNVSRANKMLGLIRRTFSYIDENIMLKLYKAYIRPIIEYCQQAMCPYLQKDVIKLENIQRRATKMIPSLRDMPYEDRLKKLNLYTLSDRRRRGDLIIMFKLMKGLMNIDVSTFFEVKPETSTRGHNLKVQLKRCNSDVKRNFFTHRVILPWNNLPIKLINCKTVNEFKTGYDKLYGPDK